MILKYSLLCSFLMVLSVNVKAQNKAIGFGFRAGLNSSKYDGPSELGPNGENLETNKFSGGFHIGIQFNYKFGDLMGFRTELLFSQRGSSYNYTGPSYYVMGRNTLLTTTIKGTRKQSLKISNAYLDIPLTFYYKIKSFEISGGLNTGLLISSSAGGTLNFDGVSPNTGKPLTPFQISLDYNYKTDKAGAASAATQDVNIDGRNYTIPKTEGAYYEFSTRDKNIFKPLDFGLIAGLSYYLNAGLYVGARYVFGLGDVDRNEYDISLQNLKSNGNFIPRADENKSRSWQFCVGFSF